MPVKIKTKRKLKIKNKYKVKNTSTNVNVVIDQSKRSNHQPVRRQPQYPPQPQHISFKPSYGSTENSDLTKVLTLLLANKLTTPNYNSPTGTTPNPAHTNISTQTLETSGENLLKTPKLRRSTPRIRLANWLSVGKAVNPPQTPKQDKKVQDSPDRLYNEDITVPKEEQEKSTQRWSLFSSGKKKKEDEEKLSEEEVPSPKVLFQGEETGGGARQPSPKIEDLADMVARKLAEYTPDGIRGLYKELYPNKKQLGNNIKVTDQKIRKWFDLDNIDKAELNRIYETSYKFTINKTKNVTVREKQQR